MIRGLILAAVIVVTLSVAHAADLEGVSMPETRAVDGTQMRLNGIGLRTYSALGIRIYVAGLYLERRSGDPDTILHSQERKLLDIRFLRGVDAEDARKAWRDAFEQNCKAPCYLDPHDVERFQLGEVRIGDVAQWPPVACHVDTLRRGPISNRR
jgi:hypothetical protein